MDRDPLNSRPSQNNESFIKNTLLILLPYWQNEERIFAWITAALLIFLSLIAVATALVVNEWYRYFYDAIQEGDIKQFYLLILIFIGVVIFSVFRSVLITYLVDILALKWRRWLTNHYLLLWTLDPAQACQTGNEVDNPDQRIAEDINKFTFETIDLACGLIFTAASVISFSIVLISASGDAVFMGITIPCYMFLAAVIYAFIGTLISQQIGFKLISLSNNQQRLEADLRYFLIRLREKFRKPPSLLIYEPEKSSINQKLECSLANFRKIIRIKMRLSLFTETYGQLALILSSLLAAPRFFAGHITFGDLMQINSAFGNLSANLSWFINAYSRIADWRATTDRLIAFNKAMRNSPPEAPTDPQHDCSFFRAPEPPT